MEIIFLYFWTGFGIITSLCYLIYLGLQSSFRLKENLNTTLKEFILSFLILIFSPFLGVAVIVLIEISIKTILKEKARLLSDEKIEQITNYLNCSRYAKRNYSLDKILKEYISDRNRTQLVLLSEMYLDNQLTLDEFLIRIETQSKLDLLLKKYI